MRSKIYSIALMAFIGLMAHSATNAQSSAPAPAAADVSAPPVSQIAPQFYAARPTRPERDTAYTSKMRKIQDQMRALAKEMSEMAREESRKATLAMQERLAAINKSRDARFDSSFSKGFSNNRPLDFSSDAKLQKQVQGGDIIEKSKTFSKSYPVDGNDKLQIDNRYGKVTINTWAKNEVKVDVDIKAYANANDEAQKLIDQTNIASSKDNNIIDFKTVIDNANNSSWWMSTNNGRITRAHKVIINYTVYMPAKSALTITNRYGPIVLPDLDGKLNIYSSYGSLIAKALTNNDNVVVVKYGSANIGSLTGSNINIAYGSLNLELADKLNAEISYSPAKIGKVNTSGVFTIRYGGLEIGDLGKSLKSLSINSSYTPVKFNSLNDSNADFDVTVKYGDFLYNGATTVTSKTPDNERGFTPTKNYKGRVGKGNNDKLITVTSQYGNVKFD